MLTLFAAGGISAAFLGGRSFSSDIVMPREVRTSLPQAVAEALGRSDPPNKQKRGHPRTLKQ